MICENCGKEHDGSYGSGRFCSKSCARSFSTKNIIKGQQKEAKCINCGKTIFINKNASLKTCNCEECKYINLINKNKLNGSVIKKLKDKKIEKYVKCPICGKNHLIYLSCENKFCQEHNIQHFRSLIKYFGFDKTKLGTSEVENEFNRVRNYLYDLYWNKNLSSTDLARLFNYKSCPTNITQKFFKNYLNIPVKSCKYATLENYLEGRETVSEYSNQYMQQWHITWNNKEVFLRSSYELDYAKELDEQHIDYEVEFKHIKYWDSQKQEYRCAIPDFYIPKDNIIVEIKSSYTLDKQNMIDKIKAYRDLGYKFKLICDHKELEI